MNPIEVRPGVARTISRIQTYEPGGITARDYNSGDTLSAACYQGAQAVAIFNPTPAWYTAGGSQTGYGQGQIQVSYTAAQAALLQPTVPYEIVIQCTLASGGDPFDVAWIPLDVRPNNRLS